ncbi:MAG: hypothetical protein GX779_04000 [Clostridia bacterium]|jgi:hypothetical protein|nr:hypothetical protein [Clostridia bacterium]
MDVILGMLGIAGLTKVVGEKNLAWILLLTGLCLAVALVSGIAYGLLTT